MGLRDIIKRKEEANGLTTKGMYFGKAEAEGENLEGADLIAYFKDDLNILNKIAQDKFIITGRKGVGKSAIAKFINESAIKESDSYASLVKIYDLGLETKIQGTQDFYDKHVIEWLILVKISKLIISSRDGQYTDEYEKLKDFLDLNSGVVEIDKLQLTGTIINSLNSIKFGPLQELAVKLKLAKKQTFIKPEFYTIIPALREVVQRFLEFPVVQKNEYWIMFDDLDVNFSVHDKSHVRRIGDMIRLAKEYNTNYLRKTKTRVLIFLRDDIRDEVGKPTDLAKVLTSYEAEIRWFTKQDYRNDEEFLIPLKQLANRRIKTAFETVSKASYNQIDPWNSLIKNKLYRDRAWKVPKSPFKYVLDFTFFRPRDIVTFLSVISEQNFKLPLSKHNVDIVLKDYKRLIVRELKSELAIKFTEYEIEVIVEDIIPYVTDYNPLFEDLLEELKGYKWEKFDSYQIMRELYRYSIIGFRNDDDNTIYFSFRTNVMGFEKLSANQDLSIITPKILNHIYF